jgi:alkylation response protein AidB-like acyl-CoA dehydrogenase
MATPNFFSDNEDLIFKLTNCVDWERIISLRENLGSEETPFESVEEAVEIYLDMLKDPIGEIAANKIAPRAADIDREGCTLKDGVVHLPEGMANNMTDLIDADLMGLTLSRDYGGLYFPTTFYTAAIEVFSRADGAIMTLFGLQGIAETIQLFGSDELQKAYLPRFSSGKASGAMVLTEPECGSDLLSIQTMATLDEQSGHWTLRGTKRFITNGCGDILLVLARSEDPKKYGGGRGLSLFLAEKGDSVKVRRIEHKLGINGSPTCELYFDDTPARLIGQRGRGLTRYVNWLMNAARLGVAAQAMGICEAAYREAISFADQREQFGKKIKAFSPIAQILVDMRVKIEAMRGLLYNTAQMVDLEQGYESRLSKVEKGDEAYKELKRKKDHFGNVAELLTPIAKYYISEASIQITSDALQVHGGNGYMKDYPIERLYRDARITNIYEGTSQLQIDRAMGKILKGTFSGLFEDQSKGLISKSGLDGLLSRIEEARRAFQECLDYIKEKSLLNPSTSKEESDIGYRNLVARNLVDMGAEIYMAYLLLEEAGMSERKKTVAERYINCLLPRIEMNHSVILGGDRSPLNNFDQIIDGKN